MQLILVLAFCEICLAAFGGGSTLTCMWCDKKKLTWFGDLANTDIQYTVYIDQCKLAGPVGLVVGCCQAAVLD